MASILGYKRNGYFIDLAANDAVRLSNTRAHLSAIMAGPGYASSPIRVITTDIKRCELADSSSLPWPTPSPTSNSGTRARLVA